MNNREEHKYYLLKAEQVARNSTCLKRSSGAIIVKDNKIISSGYISAPEGRLSCVEIGECIKNKVNLKIVQKINLCRSVHAEQNAIINACKSNMKDATMYIVGIDIVTKEIMYGLSACSICKRLIINSGISKVIITNKENGYKIINVSDWIKNDDSLECITDYIA